MKIWNKNHKKKTAVHHYIRVCSGSNIFHEVSVHIYKIVKYNGITLKTGTLADNCCDLRCSAIVCIQNIAYCTQRNIPMIIDHEFLIKEDLYNIPCPFSLFGIYTVHSCSNLKLWPLKDVIRKYVKLSLGDKYVVLPLLHTEV